MAEVERIPTADSRYVIEKVPSGKIEMVLVQGAYLTLQFNAECMDVLHVCKAMCCRARAGLNIILDQEELPKFQHKMQKGLPVLQGKEQDDTCVYLDGKSECTVHSDKPRACRIWHCSPEGKGEGIEVRAGGWFLSPM